MYCDTWMHHSIVLSLVLIKIDSILKDFPTTVACLTTHKVNFQRMVLSLFFNDSCAGSTFEDELGQLLSYGLLKTHDQ